MTDSVEKPTPGRLRRIGLTGGVAAGKSTLAQLFREAGIVVCDLDQIGRELLDQSAEIRARVAIACGLPPTKDGTLDRRAVREVIFASAEKRHAVEAILHPAIWTEFQRRCVEWEASATRLVVCEAALLLEAGLAQELDGLLVVVADDEERRRRLCERDGMMPSLADKILAAQWPQEKKAQAATEVIRNEGDRRALRQTVLEIVDRWRRYGWIK